MSTYEYKSLIKDFDRFFRESKKGQQTYIERLTAYIKGLSKETITGRNEYSDENITHRLRLIKIASLCIRTYPEYLPFVTEQLGNLKETVIFMSPEQKIMYDVMEEKINLLNAETEG